MRVFGFKLIRFSEWTAVVREEARASSLPRLLGAMLVHAWRNRSAGDRRRWRARLRVCRRCPIYDRSLRRCRPYTGADVGCGCYVPFLALFSAHCWATENLAEED